MYFYQLLNDVPLNLVMFSDFLSSLFPSIRQCHTFSLDAVLLRVFGDRKLIQVSNLED